MFKQGIKGVDFIVCIDSQALQNSPVQTKLVRSNLTEGLGAGANPDVGHQSAESMEEIEKMLILTPK
jgi:cell division protein FtsZ